MISKVFFLNQYTRFFFTPSLPLIHSELYEKFPIFTLFFLIFAHFVSNYYCIYYSILSDGDCEIVLGAKYYHLEVKSKGWLLSK